MRLISLTLKTILHGRSQNIWLVKIEKVSNYLSYKRRQSKEKKNYINKQFKRQTNENCGEEAQEYEFKKS